MNTVTSLSLKPSAYNTHKHIYKQSNLPLRISVDLREWDSLVESQDQLGSCVGNAIANAYELLVKQKQPEYFVELSRLFIYYNSRSFDNETATDVGSTLLNGLRSVKQYGICKETLWPYDVSKFDIKPTDECYIEGKHRTLTVYQYLSTVRDIVDVLNKNIPAVIGLTVYDDFMTLTEADPVLHIPLNSENSGSHAMSIVGYDLVKKQLLAKNSFGANWGANGYCYIPFDYVVSEMFEAWCFDISNQSTIQILTS
jgi:C1A family cysteine protease